MSHYTVAVISKTGKEEELSELLKPFNENTEVELYISKTKAELIEEKKKEIEEYKKGIYSEFIKNPEEYKEKYSPSKGHINYLENEFPKKLKYKTDEEFYQDAIIFYADSLDKDGNYVSTYNPNSKWDYYTIGGRWEGQLKRKADSLSKECAKTNNELISKLDFSQEKSLIKEAERMWELSVEKETITEEEREELFALGFYYNKEYLIKRYQTKEQFIKEYTSFSTFAVLTPDGEWHEPGRMGWFGISHSEAEDERIFKENYFENFIKPYSDPKDGYWITIFDCHI